MAPEPPPPGGGSPAPVVVLIEDEPQIRRSLRATLGSQGYRLHEATSGEEGLADMKVIEAIYRSIAEGRTVKV